MLEKIICLFTPPLIDDFEFQSNKKIKIFHPEKNEKINQFCLETIAEEKYEKLVLINYPQQENQFNELHEKLEEINKKITDIILLDFDNYDLVVEIQNEHLICPECQKIFRKKTEEPEVNNFFCPNDGQKFTLKKMNNFSENNLKNYFTKSKNLIEKILTEYEKTIQPFVNRIVIRKKEEIYSKEIHKKLWELISDI